LILVRDFFLQNTTYSSYYNDIDKSDNSGERFVIVRNYKR